MSSLFSVAGKQLGDADERDLFEAIRLVEECEPRAVPSSTFVVWETRSLRHTARRSSEHFTSWGMRLGGSPPRLGSRRASAEASHGPSSRLRSTASITLIGQIHR